MSREKARDVIATLTENGMLRPPTQEGGKHELMVTYSPMDHQLVAEAKLFITQAERKYPGKSVGVETTSAREVKLPDEAPKWQKDFIDALLRTPETTRALQLMKAKNPEIDISNPEIAAQLDALSQQAIGSKLSEEYGPAAPLSPALRNLHHKVGEANEAVVRGISEEATGKVLPKRKFDTPEQRKDSTDKTIEGKVRGKITSYIDELVDGVFGVRTEKSTNADDRLALGNDIQQSLGDFLRRMTDLEKQDLLKAPQEMSIVESVIKMDELAMLYDKTLKDTYRGKRGVDHPVLVEYKKSIDELRADLHKQINLG